MYYTRLLRKGIRTLGGTLVVNKAFKYQVSQFLFMFNLESNGKSIIR